MYRTVDWVYKENDIQRIQLDLRKPQYTALLTFLEEQLHKPFNLWGYWLNFWTCARIGQRVNDQRPATSWFCSELITAALQHVGFLAKDMDPCKVSPGMLIKALEPHLIKSQLALKWPGQPIAINTGVLCEEISIVVDA